MSSNVLATPNRTEVSLDRNWRFHLGEAQEAINPSYDDSNWRLVDLPHDYAVEGNFIEESPNSSPYLAKDWYWLHGFLPVQPAVYRKEIDIPAGAEGKKLWLEFNGVCSNSTYWLNGKKMGTQFSGYTRSRFDITAQANPGGRNILVVQVDPRYDGWWYEGAGIYRHVNLITVDPVHIIPDGLFVAPEIKDPGEGITADSTIRVETAVANDTNQVAKTKICNEIFDAEGNKLADQASEDIIAASTSFKFAHRIALPQAKLWSPESPYLYTLKTTISVSGKVVDQVTTKFGVRHIRFDAEKGFFLNGKHLVLRGVNMHQDHAGVGTAMPDRLFTWRLERLREMGCNAIRMSHNPVEPFLMDECDRMGFLVIAENRHLGDTYVDQAPVSTPAIEHRDLSLLVLRDRNHPSIILWSLCNEQWISGSAEAAAIIRAMRTRVHKLDPTRPVTAALNCGFDSLDGMISELDVVGINYNPWSYDQVHTLFPDKPLLASEIASEICTRGIYSTDNWEDYYGDKDRGYVSAYSITAGPAGQTVEKAWPPVISRENFAGAFVWAAFDYKGEPRPFSWPVINCHYGFMDICGFPKDSYYYYKSWWTQEPVLHLFPHWNWEGKEGKEISVWVHSNCGEVELFLNGKSLGKKKTNPYHHLEWKVKYAPGKIIAKGTYNGQTVEDTRETTGEPFQIRLIADRSELTADYEDLSVVTVEVLDAQGRIVPIAQNKIQFKLSGPARIIGVGNGNPSCLEPDKGDSRSVFNGLAQVIIQTNDEGGTITLDAQSPGLKSASVQLHSK
ncbi:MAG: DUF4982 domain-containing protein [Opitutales bacterium]|nr:DUF4982 domain-containing protein [Opitutales bacterium]